MIRRLLPIAAIPLVIPLAAAAPHARPARDLTGLWLPAPVGAARPPGLWSAEPAPTNPRFHPPARVADDACPLLGTPRLLDTPTRIAQTPGQLTMTYPDARDRRSLHTGTPLPDATAQTPTANTATATATATAQWQGDTLVIHTDHLPATLPMDAAGTRHSTALQITERWTRLGPDRIEVDAVAIDRQAFTRAWTSRHAFVRASRTAKTGACAAE